MNTFFLDQPPESTLSIGKGAGFGNFTFAQPVFAIVENENRYVQGIMKLFEIMQAMADIAGITVKPEQYRPLI